MESIQRKISFEEGIYRGSSATTVNFNTVVYGQMTADTFYLKIMLTQNMDDMGILTDIPFISASTLTSQQPNYTILANKLLMYDVLSMRQMILKFEKTDKAIVKELDKDYDFFCGIKAIENEISLEELESNLERYSLLDVREEYEREDYNIGGQHIPLDELDDRLDEVLIGKPVVVYCETGKRSERAIAILEEELKEGTFINLKNGLL